MSQQKPATRPTRSAPLIRVTTSKAGQLLPGGEPAPDLEALLQLLQARHIILQARARSVAIWSPGVRVPRQIRAAISYHRREILRRIAVSHISVCPSPVLHRSSWVYVVRRDCCDVCAMLKPEIARMDEQTATRPNNRIQRTRYTCAS